MRERAPCGVRMRECAPLAVENADSTIEQRCHNFSIRPPQCRAVDGQWWTTAASAAAGDDVQWCRCEGGQNVEPARPSARTVTLGADKVLLPG